MYRFFEHTADIGLEVRAGDLDELFRDAARGLFEMIVDELPREPPSGDRQFRIEGSRRDYLLFDWLHELLYVFDVERLLLGNFDVSVGDKALTARADAWPLAAGSDRLHHEVKAITYHELTVERTGDGWLARVIVDI